MELTPVRRNIVEVVEATTTHHFARRLPTNTAANTESVGVIEDLGTVGVAIAAGLIGIVGAVWTAIGVIYNAVTVVIETVAGKLKLLIIGLGSVIAFSPPSTSTTELR